MRADNPLHRARLDRGLELAQLADDTSLSPWVVQKIDAGHFDQLPPGIYARAYVRTFASAVGLEPEQAVKDLSDRLPAVEDPFPVLREIATRDTPAWVRDLTSRLAGVRDRAVHLAAHPAISPEGVGRAARRVAAAALDAGILLTGYPLLLLLTAWTSGVDFAEVAAHAAGVVVVWLVVASLYFLMLGGIGGATPGARALGLNRPPRPARLQLHAILDRAFRYSP